MRKSAVNLGHTLELPCHHFCMLLGLRPSQHTGAIRWEVENRELPFGVDMVGCYRPRDDYMVGSETVAWGT